MDIYKNLSENNYFFRNDIRIKPVLILIQNYTLCLRKQKK